MWRACWILIRRLFRFAKDMRIKNSFILSTFFILFCLPSISAEKSDDKSLSKRVLIISEEKYFKDPVIFKVKSTLKKDGCYILHSNKKKITDTLTKNFGVVVIVNPVRKGQKNRGVKVFLSQSEQKKVVLFNPVGDIYWESGDNKSDTENSEKIAKSIVAIIRAMLKIYK